MIKYTRINGGIVMKFREFITAFTFIILLALLLCIVYARATWEGEAQPASDPTVTAEETAESEQSEAPEPSQTPVYYEMYFTEEDVAAVAKMLWGEARGCARDNQIKCAWVVVNRVDDERFPDTIQGVLSQPNQFHGYDPSYPVTGELYDVAFDVLTRWSYEKQGIPVRRELASSFLWFTGNGQENIFREAW